MNAWIRGPAGSITGSHGTGRMTGMTRRAFIALLGARALPAAAGGRPNIILCMGDDHGWFETGYNGHPFVKTPVLDQMAARGLRLDRFYAAHPNCSPTRGSIMTGRHPNRYGTFAPGWSIRPEEITIAQILRRAGYATGHFGKWHLGPVKAGSPTSPGAMGFDEWVSHDNFYEVDPVFSRNGGAPEKIPGREFGGNGAGVDRVPGEGAEGREAFIHGYLVRQSA
jgi:arylsulfatase A-like enzyme